MLIVQLVRPEGITFGKLKEDKFAHVVWVNEQKSGSVCWSLGMKAVPLATLSVPSADVTCSGRGGLPGSSKNHLSTVY